MANESGATPCAIGVQSVTIGLGELYQGTLWRLAAVIRPALTDDEYPLVEISAILRTGQCQVIVFPRPEDGRIDVDLLAKVMRLISTFVD